MTTRKKKVVNNYVYLILDESGSMNVIRNETVLAINEIIDTVRRRGAVSGQTTYVSLQTFSTTVKPPLLKHAPIDALRNFTLNDYQPDNQTALFDAIGEAVERMDAVEFGKNDSAVFFIITDGEENKSIKYSALGIRRLIEANKHRYTFGFNVPPGRATSVINRFGIPAENINEWENTRVGTQCMSQNTSGAVGNYFDDRAAGKRTSQRLFAEVQSNVVAKGAIKKSLDDISSHFKQYVVDREIAIREFIENVTGDIYVPGSAFYQLMKPETVQPTKEVVLQEKVVGRRKGAIYGGVEARDLIGLPQGQYAKVTPGNHGNFDVFIESRSINRILPRGTKVLHRV